MAARSSKPITIVHLLGARSALLGGLLACTLVSVRGETADRAPARSGAIVSTADLRQHVQMMRERSATFREQWSRIEAAPVFVRIRLDPLLQNRRFQARTIINRLVDGAIVAEVEIGACGDPTEWLAHELEHILEQIEGVNLDRLARSRLGVWSSSDNAFETERAIRVGRAVRREVKEVKRN